MGDPLSIAAGTGGLLSLGIQVTQSLINYYASYKSQESTVLYTLERLESLQIAFQYLETSLAKRKFQVDEQSLLHDFEKAIESCRELINELDEECQEFRKHSLGESKSTLVIAGRRAIYPFRQSTLQKIDEDNSEVHTSLKFALSVLHFEDTRKIQDEVTNIESLLQLVRADQISSTVLAWLKAPDATVNHNEECAKAHPRTGLWFVKGPMFMRWLRENNSFLWLTGFPGSGKSVLCSTAIQFTHRYRKSDPHVGIAFFYFTFRDDSKQDDSAMLRALLLQLSAQRRDGFEDLCRLQSLHCLFYSNILSGRFESSARCIS